MLLTDVWIPTSLYALRSNERKHLGEKLLQNDQNESQTQPKRLPFAGEVLMTMFEQIRLQTDRTELNHNYHSSDISDVRIVS